MTRYSLNVITVGMAHSDHKSGFYYTGGDSGVPRHF